MPPEEYLSTDTKDCREARDRADRDDGGAGPRPADRVGKEHLRHAEKPTVAGLRRYHHQAGWQGRRASYAPVSVVRAASVKPTTTGPAVPRQW
jgi:hypothetical protein